MPDEFALNIESVSHSFGSKRVLNNINLKIDDGQIIALVGPSGCGKSTLLRAILGTHPPNEGTINIYGKPRTSANADVGIVYQDYALYNHMTTLENVAFGLKAHETTTYYRTFKYFEWKKLREHHYEQAEAVLRRVGLEYAMDKYPSELSGGMRQRVAIAQAIIMKPKVLLLDEPFGALDETTRESLQIMLLEFYKENLEAKKQGKHAPYTILIVTHELDEAFIVSDRICGLSQHHADGHNGATIVYDKATPIFWPGDELDTGRFEEQKEEVRKMVMDANVLQQHHEFITFWKEHNA